MNKEDYLQWSKRTPIVIDFYADWCGPCKVLTPILENAAEEWSGAFELVKVNVDENQDLARNFDIMSMPTVLFLSDGEISDSFIGAQSKSFVAQKISNFMGIDYVA